MTELIVHVGWQPHAVVEEVLEQRLAVRRVHDLGVELHAVDAARSTSSKRGRRGVGRGGGDA